MKLVFWASAALIFYTYLGYPAWLWLRSHVRPWPVQRGPYLPHVSAAMVVRNEENTLPRKLQNLSALDYPPDKLDFVIVSDGSTDRTASIISEQASRDPRFHLIAVDQPSGKAHGLNCALKAVQGEVILFTDARQEIEPGALRLLVEDLADPAVGCASGELMLGDASGGESGEGMGLYWRVEKWIRELESASGSVVGATGAIYAARRALLPLVPQDTILDDVYLPMHVVRQGFRVVFDSRARAWDHPNLGAKREFSRKVRTLGGNYQLLQLAPWLLTGANPVRFALISHKLLRLIVPVLLLVTLISSVFLTGPLYRLFFFLQLCFYASCLLAFLPFRAGVLNRLGNAVCTFVVLNTAAAVAFGNFVSGRRTVWTR
ncbi:MAG TPA: glycosyltransferase family 2 protein [Terriglobales bacterium]|nr:glycosyltransferase family 2 protein [Terriglobales bacterium]